MRWSRGSQGGVHPDVPGETGHGQGGGGLRPCVAKSDLAPFGVVPVLGLWRSCGPKRRSGGGAQIPDPAQDSPTVPERNTQMLQVSIRQFGENIDINIVLGKADRILGQSEYGQPLC